jgi:hypothetical protein
MLLRFTLNKTIWLAGTQLQATRSAAHIAKSEVIFCSQSIKFSVTALTSASFHISAGRMAEKSSSGKQCLNYKSMPCTNAQSLAVIFVTKKSSSIWLEHNYSNISKEIVLKS